MSSNRTLQGKTALIIGASTGMGRATARSYAKAGAEIVVGARNEEALRSLVDEAKSLGSRAAYVTVDVQDRDQVKALYQRAVSELGKVDVVVYASGTNVPQRAIDEVSGDDWHTLIETNLTGAFHCTQEAVNVMLPQGEGTVIYISSVSAKRGDRSGAAYQASKHGIEGIVLAAREELKGKNLRFCVVYPGLCDTPLVDKRPVPPTKDEREIALKPQDIADACLYIASTPQHVYVKELVIDTTHPF